MDVLDQPGEVYEIGCDTNKEAYIGETGRTAKVRRKESETIFRNGRLQLSAVVEHVSKDVHKITWEPKVIDKAQVYWERRIKEDLL